MGPKGPPGLAGNPLQKGPGAQGPKGAHFPPILPPLGALGGPCIKALIFPPIPPYWPFKGP